MISFPNCKINLGLRITRKRPDGFHDLQTIFYPVPLTDALELLPSHNGKTDVTWSQSGIPVDGEVDNNLCIKAYRLLKVDFPALPPVTMHLHKAIPLGAGLGGGSADGSFTLKMLNEQFNLGLTPQQLLAYALQLGSDCPFFIINQPCLATGRGEELQLISISLAGYLMVLVNPGIHINTGWAFRELNRDEKGSSSQMADLAHLESVAKTPVADWKNELINDFEAPVFRAHPGIAAIKEQLYRDGAIYAAMSGTGSTMYGLFENPEAVTAAFPENYLISRIQL